MDKNETPADSGVRYRIRKIEVKGLCGRFDHTIELNTDERVTIVHGPNGVGKTAILRMVHALSSGSLRAINVVPFSSLELILENPSTSVRAILRLEPSSTSGPNQEFRAVLSWADQVKEDAFTIPERGIALETSPWLQGLRERTSTYFIETQRLEDSDIDYLDEHGNYHGYLGAVSGDAEGLAQRISETMASFGRDSQALEQTFPQRLLRMSNGQSALDSQALQQRMAALDAQRDELERLGLLEQVESHPIELSDFERLEETEKKVLTLYVEDSEKKLENLKDLAGRIRLFLDFVNRKFRHKKIRIDREAGFVAQGDDGRELRLGALSSGEQHELILLYDLLFEVKPNTLVLIDEPEISLHLEWQRQFLPELLEIAKVAQFDALVATHSPFIVGDRSDLMIELSDET